MTHRIISTAWFVVFVSLGAPSSAAEPEFMTGQVTESRTYWREEAVTVSPPVAELPHTTPVPISRVTVALEGVRITGEWKNWGRGATAEDFPLDSDVQAAIKSNQLLLKHPNGSVVSARIVRRVKSEEDERD